MNVSNTICYSKQSVDERSAQPEQGWLISAQIGTQAGSAVPQLVCKLALAIHVISKKGKDKVLRLFTIFCGTGIQQTAVPEGR